MFRLLIVDDEEYITDGLYDVISELDELELDICKAYSASEALEWLNRTRIDIVLTDIRMPGMDGIELFERIKANWPFCRTIFLTGYKEFEYVYQAIQTPGVSYLLKTEGYDKVIAKVTEAVQELENSLHINDLLQRSQELEQALESHLHEQYLRELLTGKSVATERSEHFEKLKIRLDANKPVLLALCQLPESSGDGHRAVRKESLGAVRYLTTSFLAGQMNMVSTTDQLGNIVWFMQPISGNSGIADAGGVSEAEAVRFVQGTLELIQKACEESLDFSIAFAMDEAVQAWDEAASCYERLQQLLWLRAGDGVSMITTVRSQQHEPDVKSRARERTSMQKVELLLGYLDSGHKAEFENLLEEYEHELRAAEADGLQAMELYYALKLALISHIQRWKSKEVALELGRQIHMEHHASWSEAMEAIKEVALSLFVDRHTDERRRAQEVVQRVRSYVEEQLAGDLSLVTLSELVFFNPSYLSRLFKQECGMTLSAFIEETRLRKAKELLEKSELKIHEVGAAIGYETAHSFTRFFKKALGITPQEYRNKVL